jgi:hypothetical protein
MGGMRWVAIAALVSSACGDNPGGTNVDSSIVGDGGGDSGIVPDPNDHVAPTIVSMVPTAGAVGVWLHDRFAVTFSEPIAPATVTTQSLRLLDPMGQNISGEVAVAGAVGYVRAIDSAAFVGQLQLVVDTTITDLNGNALATSATYAWTLDPWARPAGGIAVGATPQAPAIGVAVNDTVWMVTAVGGSVVVEDANGQTLGSLATTNAITPVIAGTSPVVAWADTSTQTIEGARWNGTSWVSLPSPGGGTLPALAASPGGVVGIVWVDPTNHLASARLVGDSWQVGSPISATRIVSDPSLAMPDDTTLVAGFIDRTALDDRVRVATVGVGEQAPLTLTALPPAGMQNHVTVAARGSTIAVAWDEYSGHSFSSHVALTAGASWTATTTLDVDPPGDTVASVVQLDASGAPVVVWTERIEGAYRGFAARWTGSAWATIGGYAWTGSASLAPGRAAFRLWRDVVPVVTWTTSGATTLELARFNGPATPALGIASRGSLAGCAFDPTNPPATLTATGCFAIVAGVATPHAGLVPYDLISELWSDGALKRRWIAVPSRALSLQANGSLDAPVGSFIIKEFGINDPAARTIMETRFLARTASGWQGFSYRWRLDGSNADLLAGNSEITVSWPLTGGGTHDHIYPSRAQCQRCHNASVGQLLGVRPEQIARRFDYNGVLDDQLRVLATLGLYSATAAVTSYPAPHDPRIALEQRVRGYLAANCAHCHNPAGERSQQDFRLATPLASTGLCALVVPGDPAHSTLYQRDSSRPGMPPIATNMVDPLIVDIEARWIASMTSCP